MKFLFIHARVTLKYFNFKRENKFKICVVYFYCFSDNCCRAVVGGNEIDPHLNHHDHSFKGLLDLWAHSYFNCSLIPHPKHCGDLVWHMLTLCKKPLPIGYARLVVTRKWHANVTLQAVELFHHSILFFIIILYTTAVNALWACLHWLLVSPFPSYIWHSYWLLIFSTVLAW